MANVKTFTLHVDVGGGEIVIKNLSRIAVQRYRKYYEEHYKTRYIYTS